MSVHSRQATAKNRAVRRGSIPSLGFGPGPFQFPPTEEAGAVGSGVVR